MDLAKRVGLSPSDLRAVVASGMFDERFYLKTYPDVAEAGIDPFEHYLTFGRFEKRRPSAIFDPVAYAESNPEVITSGMEPFLHYVLVGQAAGAPLSKAETTPPRPALTREIACGTKRLMLSKLGRIKAFVKTLAGSARATPSKVCVYTAVFAGYDSIVEHVPQTVDCDFLVFTDDGSGVPTEQFRVIIKNNPGDQTSPGRKNGWLRLFPFDTPELNDYEILIYIDPNARICDPSFIQQILRRCEEARDFDLMLSAHPWNVCLYQEARDSQKIAKYNNTDLERQIALYRREGFPADAGLYWNGFIVYNRACDQPRVRQFQNKYWHEVIAYNKTPDAHAQGQVSLPYCLWKSGLKLVTIPQLYQSPSLEIRPHLR
jgi:TOD1/MUCI70, glycosyltransferase-like domain